MVSLRQSPLTFTEIAMSTFPARPKMHPGIDFFRRRVKSDVRAYMCTVRRLVNSASMSRLWPSLNNDCPLSISILLIMFLR